MLNKRFFGRFFLAVLIALCCGCASQKATRSELSLFPKTDQAQIWLVNTLGFDKQGAELHQCVLVSVEPKTGFASYFVSQWSFADSSFRSGARSSESDFLGKPENFPLKWALSGDSLHFPWSGAIGRRKAIFKAAFSSGKQFPPQTPSFFTLRAKYNVKRPFLIEKLTAEPEILALQPCFLKGYETSSGKKTSTLNMRVFNNPQALIQIAEGISLAWLDLLLPDGRNLSLFLKLTQTETTLLGTHCWDAKGANIPTPEMLIKVLEEKVWQSPHSSKAYPLGLSIQFPGDKRDFLLIPSFENQEIQAKKSSFWMGAVNLMDIKTTKSGGRGNMYIFMP